MGTTVSKNKTAKVQTKTGREYSYKYVDIAQIHDYLESVGAKYIQKIERIDGDDYIMTKRCFDNIWENEWLQGSKVVDATLFGTDNPAQKQGSALTYARRYSLLMAFGLATDDDDAACLTMPGKEPTLEEAKNYTITFGKNKGKKLVECDNGYLNWLLNNTNDTYVQKCIELVTGNIKPTDEEFDIKIELMSKLEKLMLETNIDREKFYESYKVKSNLDMSNNQLENAISILEKRLNINVD